MFSSPNHTEPTSAGVTPGIAVYTFVAVLSPSCPVGAAEDRSGSNASSVIFISGTGSPIAEHFKVN